MLSEATVQAFLAIPMYFRKYEAVVKSSTEPAQKESFETAFACEIVTSSGQFG